MKLKNILVAAALFALPFAPMLVPSAHAALNLTDKLDTVAGSTGAGYDQATATTLTDTIGQLISVLLGFLGVIFLILIIYAGLLWMTAAGNEDKVKKAQGILMSSVIGLIILLSAYAISYFVISNIQNSI
ncbi:TPA: hypothetical protein DEP96_01215 [Candidatus Uhrbacteria bacterium]|nr:hypothetical protein [Candidatus Uhrbacteria bacterium]